MADVDNDMLESRLIDLESRVAFQEQAIVDLSDALAEARLEASTHARLLQNALDDLRLLRTLLYADPANEPPPPHY